MVSGRWEEWGRPHIKAEVSATVSALIYNSHGSHQVLSPTANRCYLDERVSTETPLKGLLKALKTHHGKENDCGYLSQEIAGTGETVSSGLMHRTDGIDWSG